ncbi:hypothetical protein VI817_009151 [Penicillium citrinum]|nr:hypothetical protein VI817_009151 [Penicillium citrinum]
MSSKSIGKPILPTEKRLTRLLYRNFEKRNNLVKLTIRHRIGWANQDMVNLILPSMAQIPKNIQSKLETILHDPRTEVRFDREWHFHVFIQNKFHSPKKTKAPNISNERMRTKLLVKDSSQLVSHYLTSF